MSHSTLIGSTSRLSLRTAVIPSLLNCTASSSSSTSTSSSSTSSRASFHTSSTPLESKRKIVARQKKQKNLALRTERSRQDVQGLVDPILGDLKPEVRTGGFFARQQAGSNANTNAKEEVGGKYDRSLLKKVVLDRQSIWFSQPPQYPSQYTVANSTFPAPIQPAVYTASLSSTSTSSATSNSSTSSNPTSTSTSNPDQTFLFKHLPETLLSSLPAAQSAKLGKTPSPSERRLYEEALATEAKMGEQVMRVLDLRNADAKGIRKESVRRIVEVFGGDLNVNADSGSVGAKKTDEDDEPVTPRMNTGHPTVTSAILTHRIHLLNTHLLSNPRDVHNKKRLRELVHQRAKILNYYKKRVGRRGGEGEGAYLGLLDKLGLDRRGVEGELIVR